MFWGHVLKEGQPYKVQHALEDGDFPALHLSCAILAKDAKENAKTYVTLSKKETDSAKSLKNLVIAVLDPKKNDVCPLDVFLNLSQDITLSCQGGKNEVHLSGYFEPNNIMEGAFDPEELEEDDEELELDDDEEDDDEEEEEAPVVSSGKAAAKGDQTKAGAAKQAKAANPETREKNAAKDVEGFKKGGDVDKALKEAKKNAIRNAALEAESSDDDEDEDESSGDIDPDADDGEDEELDSDELVPEDEEDDDSDVDGEDDDDDDLDEDEDDSSEEDAVQQPVISKGKDKKVAQPPVKAAATKVESSSDEDDSDMDDDDSDDDEEQDLQALMKKSKHAVEEAEPKKRPAPTQQKQPAPTKVQKTHEKQTIASPPPQTQKPQPQQQSSSSSAAQVSSPEGGKKKRKRNKKKSKN